MIWFLYKHIARLKEETALWTRQTRHSSNVDWATGLAWHLCCSPLIRYPLEKVRSAQATSCPALTGPRPNTCISTLSGPAYGCTCRATLRLPVIPSPVKQPACHKAGMTLSSPSETPSLPLVSHKLLNHSHLKPHLQALCQLPGQVRPKHCCLNSRCSKPADYSACHIVALLCQHFL